MAYTRYGLVAILVNMLVLPLNASAVPLSDLIDLGASITAGDKFFTNFTAACQAAAAPCFLLMSTYRGFQWAIRMGCLLSHRLPSPEHSQDSAGAQGVSRP